MKNLIPFLLIAIVTSCNPNIDYGKIIPSEVDQFSRNFIEDLKNGNVDNCLNNVIVNMKTDEGRTFLTNVSTVISLIQFDSLEMINATFTKRLGDNPATNYTLEYEQEIRDQSIYFAFQVYEENGSLNVSGFDARQMEVPLKVVHAFTFTGKSVQHFVFFLFSILIVGFVLYTIYSIAKSSIKLKWAWIIGTLIAFAKFKLNWTTGELDWSILNIQLLGAGFHKLGLVAPWFLSFSIPVVALAFWVNRYNKKREEAQDEKIAAIMSKYENKTE